MFSERRENVGSKNQTSTRIRVEGEALLRLNELSDQFRLSRTQIVALLVETATDTELANALLDQSETSKQ